MRTCLCLSVLLAGALLACKGQPHATPPAPAPTEPAAAPSAGEPPATAPDHPPEDRGDIAPGDADGATDDVADDATPVAAPAPDKPALPQQGQPCPEGACADGLHCLGYYGIAGTQGPRFSSCEIPCTGNPQACPEGQRCVTIPDGPGQVCRPR